MDLPYMKLAARGAFAGFFIFVWLLAASQGRSLADEDKKAQAPGPFVFNSVLINGQKAGELVLGRTTFHDTLRMFPAPPFSDYDGGLRPADGPLPEGYPEIKYVYNPWQTMYALFFDEDKKLVMVSELYELGSLSEKELLKRYPGLMETSSTVNSIEYRGELQECTSLIANVEPSGRSVEQLVFSHTCE